MASSDTRSLRPRAVPGVTSPPDRLETFPVLNSARSFSRGTEKDAGSRKRSRSRIKASKPDSTSRDSDQPPVPKLVIQKKGGFKSRLVPHEKHKPSHKNSRNGVVSPATSKGKKSSKKSLVNHKHEGSASTSHSSTSATNSHIPKHYVLIVKNLTEDVTKEQLEEHFRKTGGVKNIKIPKEKGTNIGKGMASIEFKDRISHGIALRLHNTTMAGRQISVEFPTWRNKEKKSTLKSSSS